MVCFRRTSPRTRGDIGLPRRGRSHPRDRRAGAGFAIVSSRRRRTHTLIKRPLRHRTGRQRRSGARPVNEGPLRSLRIEVLRPSLRSALRQFTIVTDASCGSEASTTSSSSFPAEFRPHKVGSEFPVREGGRRRDRHSSSSCCNRASRWCRTCPLLSRPAELRRRPLRVPSLNHNARFDAR